MSLKRKASFSSPTLMDRGFDPNAMEDVPHHLNSRTRKRFRDDRPDEQTIYANTLRMLYQAQKEPITFSPSSETASSTLEFTEPETHDPRQQTLLKFFRPTKAPTSSLQDDMRNCSIGMGSKFDSVPVQRFGIQYECDHHAAISGSSTPSSTDVMGIDMRTDASSNTGYSAEGRWFGSAGWV